MLSICFVNRNRTKVDIGNGKYRTVFPNCLESVKHSIDVINQKNLLNGMPIEICVGDFESTDVPIEKWIYNSLKGYNYKVGKFPYIESPFPDGKFFDRGIARNSVGNLADGDHLFFIDCDMIINENIIINGIKANRENKAYFPICFYNLTEDNLYGWYEVNGRGICMVTKEMFARCKWPAWPEQRSFHGQDVNYWRKIMSAYKIERPTEENYFHQFHPGRAVQRVKERNPRPNPEFPEYLDVNKDNLEKLI